MKRKANTFNIGFSEKEFDESRYAKLVAKKYNTNHSTIALKPTDFLDELMNGLDCMDTPSGDGINTYVVSKAIRKRGLLSLCQVSVEMNCLRDILSFKRFCY